MKKFSYLFSCLFIFSSIFLSSCRDNEDLTFPEPVLITNVAANEYINFGADSDYFILKINNGGEGGFRYNVNTDKDWIKLESGQPDSNGKVHDVIIRVCRDGQDAGIHNGNVYITSKFGSQTIPVQMEVTAVFMAKFNNTIFTPIKITIYGVTKTVEPQESVTFYFSKNPGILSYYAETSGSTTTNDQVGIKLYWNYNHDVSSYDIKEWNLVTSDNIFFLFMKNSSAHSLTPLRVNAGKSNETIDYIIIPKDDVKYQLGYYEHDGYTRIEANWQDDPNWYYYWEQYPGFKENNYLYLTASGSLPGKKISNVADLSKIITAKLRPQVEFRKKEFKGEKQISKIAD